MDNKDIHKLQRSKLDEIDKRLKDASQRRQK